MADVIYKKGQSLNLDNVQIKEGQILVTEDTGEMYIDVTNSDRKKINSVSNSKSGSEILIDDVSPVTHEMGVKVRGKNLLPYPYAETTKTLNGITFTDNGDGSITVNGTASKPAVFQFYNSVGGSKPMNLANRTITISGCPSGGSLQSYFLLFSYGGNSYQDFGNGITKTPNADITAVQLRIAAGATVNNLTFRPQIELGTTATDYTPYVDPTSVTVSRCGKNLLDVSKFPLTPVLQSDGSFILNNRAAIGEVDTKIGLNLPAGVYFISVDIKAPIGKNYRPKIVYVDGSTICPDFLSTGEYVHMGFATNGKAIKEIFLTFSSGSVEVQFKNFQLELGTTATDYEPYKECAEYTPIADGTIKGVTSLYPNTTLMTDTEGVLIDCEYLTKNYKYVLDNRIPKVDWQQNDETANDYIKNRPGGYIGWKQLYRGPLNGTFETVNQALNLIRGDKKKYKVIFDGVEYICTVKDYEDDIYLGNLKLLFSAATDETEPFLILDRYNTFEMYASTDDAHSIYIFIEEPVKIPEKYLDIKNTNIVNGSVFGSLRTVGSKEDIFYTMGQYAFAEGHYTTASGNYSHAEGSCTEASGYGAHTEGSYTTASALNSHTEGYYTIASSRYQHVQGKYNIEDSSNTYADIIGNGSSNTKRSNAATVDWQGNAWYAGDVYVGSKSGTNKDEGSKKLATEEYVNSAISSGGGSSIVVDTALSSTSTNPVQNKVINTALSNKVDKVSGKGLSTNDYTTPDKTKLSGIETGANKTVVDTALSSTSVNPVQNKVINTALNNKVDKVSGKGLSTNDYTTAEKNKLAGIEAGANKTVVDTALHDTSENPVQNKVINTALSNKMDKTNPTGTGSFSLNRKPGPTIGTNSHAEGSNTTASGRSSHAEGSVTQALDEASHAEGGSTKAVGIYSHAEGYDTKAGQMGFRVTACEKLTGRKGTYTLTSVTGLSVHLRYSIHLSSSKENCGKITDIDTTHKKITVDGYPDIALNTSSSSNYLTIVNKPELGDILISGEASHAEGQSTTASGDSSHAEGNNTTASGSISHAEGQSTTALGKASHAEGYYTTASGDYQHVQGKYNIEDSSNYYADIIGNGSSNTKPCNAYTLDWKGNASYAGTVGTNGADYAEFFEWLDGNPNNEDRVGYLVALDGEKIRFANPEDEILGIISANPAILGDNYEWNWNGKYLTDEFGRILYDKVEEFIDIPKVDEETGETIVEKKSSGFFDHPRINPDYDPDQEYINRRDRSEWAMVGMLGKLFVRDDGTAQINGYVNAGEGGIATASTEKTNMRVLSRVNDHIVKVLLK